LEQGDGAFVGVAGRKKSENTATATATTSAAAAATTATTKESLQAKSKILISSARN